MAAESPPEPAVVIPIGALDVVTAPWTAAVPATRQTKSAQQGHRFTRATGQGRCSTTHVLRSRRHLLPALRATRWNAHSGTAPAAAENAGNAEKLRNRVAKLQ